jgi:hypothetical protein
VVAVTARSNRSKADKDPAEWMPPYQDAHCRYITEWVEVKTRYGLTFDSTKKTTLMKVALGCPATEGAAAQI